MEFATDRLENTVNLDYNSGTFRAAIGSLDTMDPASDGTVDPVVFGKLL